MLRNLPSPRTSDSIIRNELRKILKEKYKKDRNTRIIEELGLKHGIARVDIAVVNGILHGYELKSDLDNLLRLPDQIKVYNSVLDQITLVVGKNHLYEAIKIIPDWWGIIITKVVNSKGRVIFHKIRKSEENHLKDSLAIAELLWREEALNILEELGLAKGMRSKQRLFIYQCLAVALNQKTLRDKVRKKLLTRKGWRFDQLQAKYDD